MAAKVDHLTKADLLRKLEEIPSDEPLWLLRGRDPLAPKVIADWANRANRLFKVPDTKVEKARMDSIEIQYWQHENKSWVKLPD